MVIITISTGLLKSNQYCWRMNNNKCRCLRNRMEKLSLKYVTFFISNSLTTNLYTKICLLQSFYSKFKAFNDQLIRLKFSSHLRKINVVYFCGFLSRLKSILKKSSSSVDVTLESGGYVHDARDADIPPAASAVAPLVSPPSTPPPFSPTPPPVHR